MALRRVWVGVIVSILVTAAAPGSVSSQDIEIDWTPAVNISNTATSSNRPTMAADAAGNVHVIWAEDVGGESILGIPNQLLGETNSLVYTRWDGSTWSDPVDIISVPGDSLADYASLAVDSTGMLHLVWTGLSMIYYSRSPAVGANSPHAWSAPVVLDNSARTAWESSIAVDQENTVHIVYATRDVVPAVMYVRIEHDPLELDAPAQPTTSLPIRLSPPLQPPEEVAFLHVSLRIDSKDRIHVLWGVAREEGFGQAVYYTRSPDGGSTWSEAIRLAQGERGGANVEFPSLGIVGDSELHLIYCYPANMARQERISLDSGETWGEPHTIYPELEGISGFNVQVTDAAGNLHVLSGMRTHEQVGGLVYWRWLGSQWSPYRFASIETESTGPGGHFQAATIRLGNEIHALWNTNMTEQAGEIWHTSGIIADVPGKMPVPLPLQEAPTGVPEVSGRPSSTPDIRDAHTPSVLSSSDRNSTDTTITGPGSSTAAPHMAARILIGILPALLLVVGVVVWHSARRR